MKTKEVIATVLKDAGQPLSSSEIAERVLAKVKMGGKTPKATIAGIISTEHRKDDGLFVKVDKGTYALRDGATVDKPKAESKPAAKTKAKTAKPKRSAPKGSTRPSKETVALAEKQRKEIQAKREVTPDPKPTHKPASTSGRKR